MISRSLEEDAVQTRRLFARVLAGSGLSFDELNGVGSTTFRRQFATTASVALENPALYYSIQRANRFSERVYREVERAAADWIGWVERGEPGPFAGGMESQQYGRNSELRLPRARIF